MSEKLRPFIDKDGHIFDRKVNGLPVEEKIERLVHTMDRSISSLGSDDAGFVTHDVYRALNPAFKYGNKVVSLVVYIHNDFKADLVNKERAEAIHEFIQINSPLLFSYAERFLERGLEKK